MSMDYRDEAALEAMKVILAEEIRRQGVVAHIHIDADTIANQAYLIGNVMDRKRRENQAGRPPPTPMPSGGRPQPTGGERQGP